MVPRHHSTEMKPKSGTLKWNRIDTSNSTWFHQTHLTICMTAAKSRSCAANEFSELVERVPSSSTRREDKFQPMRRTLSHRYQRQLHEKNNFGVAGVATKIRRRSSQRESSRFGASAVSDDHAPQEGVSANDALRPDPRIAPQHLAPAVPPKTTSHRNQA